MINLPIVFLIFAISAGQLIKLPIFAGAGITLLDLTLIILLLFGIFRIKIKLENTPTWLKPAFLFAAIACLSLLLTPLKLSNLEVINSFSYIARYGLYILFAFFLIYGAYPEIKNNISKIIIYSGVIMAVLGLLQLIFLPDLSSLTHAGWDPHYFRTVSTFLDPNFFGAFMTLTMLTIIRIRNIRWSSFIFLLVFLNLLTTFSRGAYLGFALAFLTFSIMNKSLKLFFLTLSLISLLGISYMLYQNLITQPRNINRTQSAQYRINSYHQGVTIFQSNPILGIGFNAYRFALGKFNLADEQFLQSRGSSTNDSSLLYVAATTGIMGSSIYILFLFSLLWEGWKDNFVLFSGLVGLLAQSFFANTLFYPFLFLWILLITVEKNYFWARHK